MPRLMMGKGGLPSTSGTSRCTGCSGTRHICRQQRCFGFSNFGNTFGAFLACMRLLVVHIQRKNRMQ